MLKKLIASVTAFAMLVNVAMPLVQAAPTVTDPEMIDAIAWGYDNGLTKYEQADAFMPFNNLTREQSAKFASEFASEVLDIQPDTTKTTTCEFKDASIMDSTLVDSITKVCQQGIMFGYQGNFMPKQLLTRGNFATMVSRMLGGIDAMSSEQAHFDYLNSLGIMKIANLSSSITRGDALLMLYRVANGSSSDLCAIDPSLPGCSNSNTGTVVKKGDLNVALNPASPVNYSSIPRVGTAPFGKVDFTAGSSDVSLYSVSLTRQGLGSASDISKIYLEDANGTKVAGKAAVSSDNKVVLSFAPALVVKAGTTSTLTLYADMSGAAAGGEHQFVSTAINSSAANVVGGFTTPILRTADYSVATVVFTSAGAANSYQVDGKVVELGQFKLSGVSPSRDVTFKQITLTNSGTADMSYLSGLVLERNGITVSTSAVVNGRDVTFYLNDKIANTISSATYTMKGIINTVDRQGDSYQFRLKNTANINIAETDTSFRTLVSGVPATLSLFTVNGADIRLATNSGFITTVRAPQGSSSVVLMSGTITAKADMSIEDIKLPITTNVPASSIVNRLTLTVGGSTFTYTPTSAVGTQTGTFDGTVVIPAGTTLAVSLTADSIKGDAATTGTLTVGSLVKDGLGTTTREYVSNGEAVSSVLGTIQGATLYVTPTNLLVSNLLSASQTVVKNATNVTVLQPKFSTSYDNSVRVNGFKVNLSGVSLAGTTWNLKDSSGSVIASSSNNGGVLSFSNLGLVISKTTAQTLSLSVDTVLASTTGAVTLTLTGVEAYDVITGNPVTNSLSVSKTVTIADAATLTPSTSTNTTKLVYAGQNGVKVGSVALRASNSTATLSKMDVTLASSNATFTTSKLNNITLKDSAGVVVSSNAILNSDTSFTFDGMSYDITAGATKTFDVYADVPTLDTTAELSNTTFGLSMAKATYLSANSELTTSGTTAMSSNIKVIKTKVTVSNPIKANGGLTPSMSFVLTPSNGNTVTVNSGSWSFLVSANNVSGATDIIVSSDPNGAGTIYATGAIGGSIHGVNDLTLSSATTVYVTIKTVTNWNATNATTAGNIVVSLLDFSYSDSVADGTVSYPNIYSSYVNELGANISATLTQ